MYAAVLADDTTGALETGAIAAGEGLDCTVTLDPGGGAGRDAQVVVVDTASRRLSPAEARARVLRAARHMLSRGAVRFYKKTDSTLRGPIAAELSAVSEACGGAKVLYAPAYPLLGRTVRGGVLLVDGVPVGETAFARDPHCPVRTSSLAELLAGAPEVMVRDGETEADLAAAAAEDAVVAAGPGGFARHWVRRLPGRRCAPPPWPRVRGWLVVCGSLHPVSRAQAEAARALGARVLATPERDYPEALEQLAAEAVREIEDGVIVLGGDTAAALLAALGVRELAPLGEALPGVPVSLAEGPRGPLAVVTKAGGFGGPGVVQSIMERFQTPG
jgi:uncharacterized protein YgbK (DUF1537 family)